MHMGGWRTYSFFLRVDSRPKIRQFTQPPDEHQPHLCREPVIRNAVQIKTILWSPVWVFVCAHLPNRRLFGGSLTRATQNFAINPPRRVWLRQQKKLRHSNWIREDLHSHNVIHRILFIHSVVDVSLSLVVSLLLPLPDILTIVAQENVG